MKSHEGFFFSFYNRDCLNVTRKEPRERKSIKTVICPLSEIRQNIHYSLKQDAEGQILLAEVWILVKKNILVIPHSMHRLLDAKCNLMKAIGG